MVPLRELTYFARVHRRSSGSLREDDFIISSNVNQARFISRSKEPTFRIDLDLVLIRRDNSKMAGNGQMIRVKRIEFMIVKMIGTGSCDCASLEYGNVRV